MKLLSSPANSTPVGPPPTITTCSMRCRSALGTAAQTEAIAGTERLIMQEGIMLNLLASGSRRPFSGGVQRSCFGPRADKLMNTAQCVTTLTAPPVASQ